MGVMENASKKRTRRGQIETVLLSTLALAGIGLMAMAAPNTVQLLKHIDPDWIRKTDPKQRIREASNRLKKKGLVEFVKEGDRVYLRITDKGRSKMSSLAYSSVALSKPKRWDRKWRLVIFDIPEKYRKQRDRARAMMIRLGFVRLQQSVWAYPYDCEEIIALLKAELHIGKDLLYIIADAIEYDKHLREQFGLPCD